MLGQPSALRGAFLALVVLPTALAAQSRSPSPQTLALRRPVANPVVPPVGFARAVASGTRTTTGAPGPRYWQQHARYTIAVRLDTAANRLDGTTRIVYLNNSPDTLRFLRLQLLQNCHRDNVPRLAATAPEITGGYTFTRVAAGGRALEPAQGNARGPRYAIVNSSMAVVLPAPLAPRDSVTLETEWSYRIPQHGISSRMGWNGDELYYLAYFYPQLAVYDDVVGWQIDPFLGISEFYAGFGDYDVTLDVPEGWVVRGTGRLLNESEVLPDEVLRRLRLAEASDTVVHVLTEQDFGPGRATKQSPDGRLRWHFAADSVRDVAYGITRVSVWDAARAGIGDRDGDGRPDATLVEAVYRPRFERWRNVVRWMQHALPFHSRHTGIPYPWSHATAVEGDGIIASGGMEYPMITLLGGHRDAADSDLYVSLTHELAHNWAPMLVNSDERRYGWMDEGTTRYNDVQAVTDLFPSLGRPATIRSRYLVLAQAGSEGELMRWPDHLDDPESQIGVQSYEKPALLLTALRRLLGEQTFARAYQGYLRTWSHRHPKPWDFFNSFSAASGRDLTWFWRAWYAETWTLDQAVASVTPGPRGTAILIRDLGDAPMPTYLTVTLASGDTLRREVPVSIWLGGARTATVSVPRGQVVTRVEIDAEQGLPDVHPKNNAWSREAESLPLSLSPLVRSELVRTGSRLVPPDYRPEGEALGGSAGSGVTETRSVTLQGGLEYAVLAVCDDGCGDLDLRVVGPSNATVAQDQNPDDTPLVRFTAPATGTYRLEVSMFDCRTAPGCGWGTRVFRR